MKMMIVLVLLFAMVSVTMEETLSQGVDKRGYFADVLSSLSCRYLKINGYLAKSVNLKKLCLKTYHCNDILSKQSCKSLKARNECTKDLSRTYCTFTCNKCGVPQCKVSVPLGMQSKAIPDSKITASTYYSSSYRPYYARLHANSRWAAKAKRVGEWLQVDLSKVSIITGIATQGVLEYTEWIKTYTLKYSIDGKTFYKYKAGKIFAGNVDKKSVVKHFLNPPILARYIRVYPKTWKDWVTFRMELYGCK